MNEPMKLMEELNSIHSPGQKKRLCAGAAAVQDEALEAMLAQAGPIAGPDEAGWRRVEFTRGFPEAVAARLRALGAAEKELTRQDAFAVWGEADTLTICANDKRGWLYGACDVLWQAQNNKGLVEGGLRFASPQCPFRGLKMYLPAPDALDQFYKVVDMLVYYRYNAVILEIGGAMEYKRHPEINESWIEYCREMARYPQRADEVQNMFGWVKNSIHFENGGGRWLSQDTVRQLVDYCRQRGLEVIPEVPCLSHSDYLLNAHQELAERPYDPFPDTYCPSNPAVYDLLFDVMDEVIEVFQPKVMQIGHDEYYSIAVCDACRQRDPADILAGDITRIHDYLVRRGIRVMYWSEKMLEHITSWGEGLAGAERHCKCSRNTVHRIPATWRAIDRIPPDCIAHHWYWALRESHDQAFLSRGMEMTYGNWDPRGFVNWQKRVEAGALGAAPSHWTALNQVTMQRNGVLLSLVFGAYLLWRTDYTDDRYDELLRAAMEELYLYHNRAALAGPHLEFTHMTTIWREHVYITSAPMEPEKDQVGKYVISFQSGRTLEVPLVYGVNIMNQAREWDRTRNAEWDCYEVDAALAEVTAATLPLLQPDGTTQFRFVVKNPWPDDPVVGVRTEKTCADAGWIYLTHFAVRQSFAASETVRACTDPSRRAKTPLI